MSHSLNLLRWPGPGVSDSDPDVTLYSELAVRFGPSLSNCLAALKEPLFDQMATQKR